MSKISIRDVAKKAGVSVSSVSLAYHKPYQLSEKTRKNILAIADELGYHPNINKIVKPLATMAIFIPQNTSSKQFRSTFFYKLSEEFEEYGYHTVLIHYHSGDDLNQKMKSIATLSSVQGAVIIIDNDFNKLKKINIPSIVISVTNTEADYINIACDYTEDITSAIKDLCKKSKTRIAVLIPQSLLHLPDIQHKRNDIEKFYKQLTKQNYNENLVCTLEEDTDDLKRLETFNQNIKPDAWIIVGSYALNHFQHAIVDGEGIAVLEEDMTNLKLPTNKIAILERPISKIVDITVRRLLLLIENKIISCSTKTLIFAKKSY